MFVIIINPKAGHGQAERLFRTIQKDPLYQNQKRIFRLILLIIQVKPKIDGGIFCALYQDFLNYFIVIGGMVPFMR